MTASGCRCGVMGNGLRYRLWGQMEEIQMLALCLLQIVGALVILHLSEPHLLCCFFVCLS